GGPFGTQAAGEGPAGPGAPFTLVAARFAEAVGVVLKVNARIADEDRARRVRHEPRHGGVGQGPGLQHGFVAAQVGAHRAVEAEQCAGGQGALPKGMTVGERGEVKPLVLGRAHGVERAPVHVGARRRQVRAGRERGEGGVGRRHGGVGGDGRGGGQCGRDKRGVTDVRGVDAQRGRGPTCGRSVLDVFDVPPAAVFTPLAPPAPSMNSSFSLPCNFRSGFACLLTFVAVGSAGAHEDTLEEIPAFKKLSMQELMDIEITSVSRRPERLSDTASSIQVITGDDIRRSGATRIPEALRLASNLHVAQRGAQGWAISARGFNTELSNKLLELVDGRTVYSQLFSGVYWDAQDYVLEDIDRIEVISGPGGSLWGANAVNGVININTKSARDTQGVYASFAAGDELESRTSVRYGGVLAPDVYFRVYGQ